MDGEVVTGTVEYHGEHAFRVHAVCPARVRTMMTITGTFTLFGYRTRELDLTPALGLALIVMVTCLLAVHS